MSDIFTFSSGLDQGFTEEYPNKPPTVRFVSKMFHPNVYADGGEDGPIPEPLIRTIIRFRFRPECRGSTNYETFDRFLSVDRDLPGHFAKPLEPHLRRVGDPDVHTVPAGRAEPQQPGEQRRCPTVPGEQKGVREKGGRHRGAELAELPHRRGGGDLRQSRRRIWGCWGRIRSRHCRRSRSCGQRGPRQRRPAGLVRLDRQLGPDLLKAAKGGSRRFPFVFFLS